MNNVDFLDRELFNEIRAFTLLDGDHVSYLPTANIIYANTPDGYIFMYSDGSTTGGAYFSSITQYYNVLTGEAYTKAKKLLDFIQSNIPDSAIAHIDSHTVNYGGLRGLVSCRPYESVLVVRIAHPVSIALCFYDLCTKCLIHTDNVDKLDTLFSMCHASNIRNECYTVVDYASLLRPITARVSRLEGYLYKRDYKGISIGWHVANANFHIGSTQLRLTSPISVVCTDKNPEVDSQLNRMRSNPDTLDSAIGAAIARYLDSLESSSLAEFSVNKSHLHNTVLQCRIGDYPCKLSHTTFISQTNVKPGVYQLSCMWHGERVGLEIVTVLDRYYVWSTCDDFYKHVCTEACKYAFNGVSMRTVYSTLYVYAMVLGRGNRSEDTGVIPIGDAELRCFIDPVNQSSRVVSYNRELLISIRHDGALYYNDRMLPELYVFYKQAMSALKLMPPCDVEWFERYMEKDELDRAVPLQRVKDSPALYYIVVAARVDRVDGYFAIARDGVSPSFWIGLASPSAYGSVMKVGPLKDASADGTIFQYYLSKMGFDIKDKVAIRDEEQRLTKMAKDCDMSVLDFIYNELL